MANRASSNYSRFFSSLRNLSCSAFSPNHGYNRSSSDILFHLPRFVRLFQHLVRDALLHSSIEIPLRLRMSSGVMACINLPVADQANVGFCSITEMKEAITMAMAMVSTERYQACIDACKAA